MSFVRVGKGPGAAGATRKKKPMKKRAWDDTVHDLTAYKATPEEIAYRKASHRSKNALSSRLIKHPGSAHKGKKSPYKSNAQARKLAIMKEVLYDQQQLQNVLEKSDTMMAVVKDLFGDDPRRFAGFPKVTSAPNADKLDATASLAAKPPPIQTRSEFLSDSMMDSSALNDLQETDSEEETRQSPVNYQPKMNMQRFQDFLEREEQRNNNNTISTISGQAGMSHLGQRTFSQIMAGAIQSSQLPDLSHGDGPPGTPPKQDLDESVTILRPPGSAINDTKKVKKTRPRVQQSQPQADHNTSNFSLTDLKKVLETLEEEIIEYERQTGRRPMADRARQESFSGYTLAIVDSVTKLTRYLKECELRLQAEMTVREQLAQDVMQFRALVDALTSDIITTQEEFGKMASEFVKFRRETQAEIQRLKGGGGSEPVVDMTEEQITVTPPRSRQLPPQQHQQQLQQHYQQQNIPEPEYELPREFPREINPFGDHLRPVSAAVMLSPPVRSRVMEPERDVNPNAILDQQGSLLNLKDLVSTDESTNSTLVEDYCGLPSSVQPTVVHDSHLKPVGIQQQQRPGVQTVLGQQTRIPTSKPPITSQTVKSTLPTPLNTVNVPRPTPLVQSNVNIPISANVGKDVNQSVPPKSHDQSHDPISMIPSSDRAFLASQIAELNKQHGEAQKRLESLMVQQKNKAPQSQDMKTGESQLTTQQQPEPGYSQPLQSHMNQSQKGNQEQNMELQHLQQLQQRQQQLQRQQQQKLLEMVQQQQQRIIEQQQQHQVLLQQQQRSQSSQQTGTQSGLPQSDSAGQESASQSDSQQRQQTSQILQPGRQSGLPRPVIPGQEALRQSADIPGYRPQQKQTGLPGYTVSPNISPISQRSDRLVYQSVDSQNGSVLVPASRGITVSIPKVDMDLSGGSPSPNPVEIVR